MKYGFFKTAACTPEIKVADCAFNAQACVKSISAAAALGASLAVLPRLCLTGSACGDLFLSRRVCDAALKALLFVARETAKLNCVSVLGLPMRLDGELYDCAAVISRGAVLGVVPRSLSEGVFSAGKSAFLSIDGKTVPFSPCLVFRYRKIPEISFNIEIDEKKDVLSPLSVFLSAQPETTLSEERRRITFTARSQEEKRGFVFCSAGKGESTGDGVFSGHKMILENGVMLAEAAPFGGETAISEPDLDLLSNICKKNSGEEVLFDISLVKTPLTRRIESDPFAPSHADLSKLCEKALLIQTEGLKKRLSHTGAKKVVLGVSGGLDSTLALLAALRAVKAPSDICALTMPCFGTSQRTKSNAEKLCESLGVPLKTIDISESVKRHLEDIGHNLADTNVTFENAQARERTQILFDIANDVNGLVLGTGDLSELALGFATYNGDHMSAYAVNAGVPKTLIRHIIRYVAEKTENSELSKTLLDIADTPVSPELLPGAQKTEDIVGPYELNDFFLYYLVKYGFAPSKVSYMAKYAFKGVFDGKTVDKWLSLFCRRFINQQFKRSCLCDGPQVTDISLSPRNGTRFPSDASGAVFSADLKQ